MPVVKLLPSVCVCVCPSVWLRMHLCSSLFSSFLLLLSHSFSLFFSLLSLFPSSFLIFNSNRKKKIIVFYEWNIELKWSGYVRGSDKKVKGSITIPNLSDENDISEVDVSEYNTVMH